MRHARAFTPQSRAAKTIKKAGKTKQVDAMNYSAVLSRHRDKDGASRACVRSLVIMVAVRPASQLADRY